MKKKKIKHLLSLKDWSEKDIMEVISLAEKIKSNPGNYNKKLNNKILLMVFAKPSLRTHISFDAAMFKLGGHAIFYDLSHSTLGKKESIKDFSKVISLYSDVVMARLYEHRQIEEMAEWADVPIINGLTDYYHPCQILGDFLTIKKKLGNLKGKKICYLGDGNNNVTHSLIIGCEKVGMSIVVSCPNNKEFLPNKKVIGNVKYIYEQDSKKAIMNADVIYTDTWMSYQIPKSKEKKRINELKKYQINGNLFEINKKALFMHCLPAKRGQEVTDDVIDNKRSIVYEQAENRMWSEMGVLLKLLGK